jgi:formate/nitrite transporter FocA (FNT family)
VCKLWAVVLVTNLAGGVIVALALAHAYILTDDVCHVLRVIGEEAMTPTRHDLFLRGIAAGWIIALMVWMLPAAQSSAPFIVFVMTWLVGAAQLPHVVVGAIEVFHLAASGGASWSSVLGHYVLPVLAGNIWGGITLVSAVNHGQVVAGRG